MGGCCCCCWGEREVLLPVVRLEKCCTHSMYLVMANGCGVPFHFIHALYFALSLARNWDGCLLMLCSYDGMLVVVVILWYLFMMVRKRMRNIGGKGRPYQK